MESTKTLPLIFWVLPFLMLLCVVHAGVHNYTFVLKEANFTRLCSTKSMLTVNGSFPGPEIRVRRGDTAFVTVINDGLYGVTIHWHGVKQPRNPWSDGPENITQCPIPVGSNFTYEIVFSTEEGTLWWHAHSDWSRATVHGAIIILPSKGAKYPFAKPYKQQTIVLASWYKGDVMAVINEALATGGNPNLTDAYTINGQPGDLFNCSKESTFRMRVKHGKRYLLRIVNAVLNEEQFFGIANHTLTVVAQDGSYIKPINVTYIMITPGQTMDVLFKADQSPTHYYMASTPYADSIAEFGNFTATAIVAYKGHYTSPTTPPFPSLPAYDDTDAATNFTGQVRALASSDHPVSVPQNVTERMYITVSVNNLPCPANKTCAGFNNTMSSASLNNISFVTPTTDILQAYFRQLPDVFNDTFPNEPPRYFNFTGTVGDNTVYPSTGTEVKMIDYNSTVEIVFQGTNIGAAENHPMHLHGFSFYLVGTGFGNFNNVSDPLTYNLVDPPEVNTIGVPKNGWAAIRFLADNPGVWFMHCHLERHASWGMDTVIIVRNGELESQKVRKAPTNLPTCL